MTVATTEFDSLLKQLEDKTEQKTFGNTNDIVTNLGGINKIILLCLTDEEYRKKNITLQNINNLNKLLTTSTRQNVINSNNNEMHDKH